MRQYYTLDVFTKQRFGGNPLAVVTDGEGLSAQEMQNIAREFNLSETTFVMPPRERDNTAHVRIFTPTAELPFAGHPTVGTAIALARLNAGTNGNAAAQSVIRLEEEAGLVPVKVQLNREQADFGEFVSPVLPDDPQPAPENNLIARALGLESGDIGFGDHRPAFVAAGNDWLFVPLASIDAVARASVQPVAWTDVHAGHQIVGAFIYCVGGLSEVASYHARMFAPDYGVAEDPATGSAAAAFPGQIAAAGQIPDGTHRWLLEQGYEMGRPSQIHLEADFAGGKPGTVRVGGHAVFVGEGTIQA